MSGPIRSLIVKEWHEQKWRCASLCAIGLSIVVFTMVYEPEVVLGAAITALFFLAFTGSVFIAMGIAAGERSSGTLDLLRALPLHIPSIALVRLMMGMLICLIPMLVVWTLASAWLGGLYLLASRGHEASSGLLSQGIGMYADPSEFFAMSVALTCSCLSVYLWCVAVGIHQRTELRAGLTSIALLMVWGLFIAFAVYFSEAVFNIRIDLRQEKLSAFEFVFLPIAGVSPFGGYITFVKTGNLLASGHNFWPELIETLGVQSITACALMTWILLRYGQMTRQDNQSPTESTARTPACAIGRPRRSPVAAVAWKQWRDARPMLLLSLLALASLVVNAVVQYRHYPRIADGGLRYRVVHTVDESSITIGIMLAIVVGIGTFVGDYQQAMLTFWRSRPINPRLWFWSKYFTGLMIVELAMILPYVISFVAAGYSKYLLNTHRYIVVALLLYWFIYSVSVGMACLLRHTVYAGVITSGIVALFLAPPQIEPMLERFSILWAKDDNMALSFTQWFSEHYLPFLIWLIVPTLLALWLATRAAKRDSAFVIER